MAIEKAIKNAKLLNVAPLSHRGNEPQAYSDSRMKSYFTETTHTFTKVYGKYAPDCVEALIQFEPQGEWEKVRLRFADYVKKSSAITRKFDNYKLIMDIDGKYSYLPLGAKIVTMGNTWLVVNPTNMSDADGKALIQRCNATWNSYDFYGNIVKEPICIEKILASASDSNDRGAVIVAKGYFNVKCQYNSNTAQLNNNSRLILGSGAYSITGYSDFEQQFTGDYDSVKMIEFTVRYDEPSEEVDDMVNHIANGKTFSWEIGINGHRNLLVGQTETFTATSVRCDETVVSSPQKPISYIWQISDEEVATVDENGAVTPITSGTATLRAYLEQNKDIYGEIELEITEAEMENKVAFTTDIPTSLPIFEEVTLYAEYYGATSELVEWETKDADKGSYKAVVMADNGLKITCYGSSVKPLKVIARCGIYFAEGIIELEGL